MWAVLRWCKVRVCVWVGVCVNCEATGAYFRTWQIRGTYASVIIIPAEFKNWGPKIIKPIDYNFHSSLINVEPPASFVWCAKPTCWVMARRGLLAECSNCLESELAAPRPQSCRNRSKSCRWVGCVFDQMQDSCEHRCEQRQRLFCRWLTDTSTRMYRLVLALAQQTNV